MITELRVAKAATFHCTNRTVRNAAHFSSDCGLRKADVKAFWPVKTCP